MNIVDFLSELRQLGIQISLNGEKLSIKAPKGALTKEIKVQLKDRKDDIIEFFSGVQKQDDDKRIIRVENPENIPLSFGQQRLWFFEAANPGTVANNMSSGIRLKGPLNTDLINRVFEELVQRHESLRTTFYVDEEGVPYQQVNAFSGFDIDFVTVDGTSEQQESKVELLLAQEIKQAFDLINGPLLRATVVLLPDSGKPDKPCKEHVLIIGMHHIISDGFSVGIFMREIAMLYWAFSRNMQSPLPPLKVQYPDFSIWQRQFLQGEGLEKQLRYWEKKLADAPILSTFPSDKPRPQIQTSNGAIQRVEFPAGFGERISNFANEHAVTPFIVLLTAWKVLLFRYCRQEDLCVGIPTSGRNQLELEPLIGFFVNSMVIRSDISGNGSLFDAMNSVKESVFDGLDNGDIPIEMAVERLKLSRNPAFTPLVQVAFQLMVEKGANNAVDSAPSGPEELSVEALKKESVSAKFDMSLSMTHSDNNVKGALEYNTDLYNAESIERIVAQFMALAEYFLVGGLETSVNAFPLIEDEKLVPFVLGDKAAEFEAVLPMTAMQRDLYLSSLRNCTTLENSLGYAVELHHKLNVDLWREELTRFTNSQSILRAEIAGCSAPFADSAYLCIRKPGDIELDVIDLSKEEYNAESLQAKIDALVRRPYVFDDTCTTKITYYHLIKVNEEHWVTILATHHLVMDGVAYAQQLLTVAENYQNRVEDPACVDLTIKPDLFSEYIEYDKQNADISDVIDYWREQLQSVEPVDFKVTHVVDKQIRKHLTLSNDHWASVRQYCKQQKITPTLYFKAIYGLMINQYCRADSDFVISEFGAGRPKGHAEAIGCYYLVNPFVCNSELYLKDASLAGVFKGARDQQKSRRGKLQFSVLQQSHLMSQGRLGFMYNYIHFYPTLNVMGVDEEIQQLIPDAESQVQLAVKLIGPELHLYLDYHGTLFEDHGFLERFESVSQQITEGVQSIGELAVVSSSEAGQLQQWSSGEKKTIVDRQIHRPIEEYAENAPDLVAIIFGGQKVSYQQLNNQANQLAHYLLDSSQPGIGLESGSSVGICVTPSPWWVISVLGVLKAGCSYIPIAADYPIARIKDILEDSNTGVILTDTSTQDYLSNSLDTNSLVLLSDELLEPFSQSNPNVETASGDLLYTIYTSGSTGKPKGASVTHKNAENLLEWYTAEYGFSEQSQNLIISSPGFDLTQKNLFAPLRKGGAIVLPEMSEYDPSVISQVINDNKITHMNCAPSALYGLVESDELDLDVFGSLRYVLLGGEAIQLARLKHWLERESCRTKLVNMYGPTECTDIAASYTIENLGEYLGENAGDIPIGFPNDNVSLHVLSPLDTLVVPGCIGELCISGESVGTGYLNRDALNESSFFEYQGQRTYRTGDLVRYGDDGQLIYVGRKDFQVKLRGLRIELDEIRYALNKIEGVKDSLALVDDDCLLGFVIADSVSDSYRSVLNEYLPTYMIPSVLTPLAEWPLTPNGKIDRKKLLQLANKNTQVYVAPETDLEIAVAGIWSEVLNLTEVSRDANFFDLGGHSLLATKIASRASQTFDIHLSVRALFECPTVQELATHISGLLGGDDSKVEIPLLSRESVSHGDIRVPLSFAQQRLWVLDKIDGGSTAYNVPLAMRIKGALDVENLEVTFAALLARHEGLRTVFREDDEGAYQWVTPAENFSLNVSPLDVDEQSSIDSEDEAIRAVVAREILRPFSLKTGPLIRANLVEVGHQDYVLIIVAHHIVTDGWSMNVLGQELATLYVTSLMKLANPLENLPLQYLDYSQWQRDRLDGKALADHLGYWKQQLDDLPNLNLPTDFQRPAVQTYAGASVAFDLSTEVRDQLESIAHNNGGTLFNALMAAFGLLLSRYTGQRDFAIGTPVAGRDYPELEKIVGFFVNTLVIRLQLDGVSNFNDLVAAVNESVMGGYEHQEVPFEQIVDVVSPSRDMSRSPLFQAMLTYQNMSVDQQQMQQNAAQAGNISLHPVTYNVETAKFDLTLSLSESKSGLSGSLQYNTDIFERKTIRGVVDHFVTLCQRIVNVPEEPLSQISMLSQAEIDQQLHQWNDTQVDYNKSQTVHQLFELQVNKTPSNVAVVFGDQSQTYADLDNASNQVANHLVSLGVKPGDRVGLCFDRSLHIMSSILGTLKAGAAYVPIDASYPEGRIRYIVEDAGIQWLLTRESIQNTLPKGEWQTVDVDTLLLEGHEATAPNVSVDSESLLYVIYTSGSTGRPKGTGAYHRSEVNLLAWYSREFSLSSNDNVMLMSALGFDLTQKNLFAPLVSGASLVIPNVQEYDPEILSTLIQKHSVSWINCAPSAFYGLQDDADSWSKIASLRCVFLGGEPINLPRIESWLGSTTCQLINSYGPTECTDIAAWHVVDRASDFGGTTLPIGRPNDNVELYILGEDKELLPIGAIGELYIGGDSVGPGYLNESELTAEAFFPNPFCLDEHGDSNNAYVLSPRIYKTGDLARYRIDGNVEYLGRIDHQVKLRGFRIETGEIEAVINEQDNVTDSLVAVSRSDVTGDRLVAWVVTAEPVSDATALESVISRKIGKLLPTFMVPQNIVFLDAFPLTPNGKVDRKALPKPLVDGAEDIVPAENATQAMLIEIWQDVLGVRAVGIKQDFFQLGGHSLLATQVVARVVKRTQRSVSVRMLFEAPTIELFADQVDRAEAANANRPDIVRLSSDSNIPLSFGQNRLWYFEQMNPGSSANNMPSAVRVKGNFNQEILQKAYKELLRRHESLRTTFSADAKGVPYQSVHHEYSNVISIISYVNDPDREEKALAYAKNDRASGFDLEQGPLVRGALLVLSDEPGKEESILTFCLHHIISDGVSMGVLLRELTTLYVAFSHKMPSPLPELSLQYADFAQWQQSYMTDDTLEDQLSYWQTHLKNAPSLLTLPTDRPRPSVQTTAGKVLRLEFSQEFNGRLSQFAREQGVTPFMVMLLSWKLLLSKYAQQESVSVGIPTAGRSQPALEKIIGFFVNSMVLNTELSAHLSIGDALQRVRESVLGGFANADVPVDMVLERLNVERNPAYTPLAQVAFQLATVDGVSADDQSLASEFEGLSVEPIQLEGVSAKFDMTLSLSQSTDLMRGDLEFNTDLFDEATIEDIIGRYIHLSEAIVNDPSQQVGTIALCTLPELMDALDISEAVYSDVLPLSSMQYDMFMDNLVNPSTLQSSHGWALDVHNAMDVSLWQRCLQAFSDNAPILRSKFVAAKPAYLDMGYLAIRREHVVNFESIDISADQHTDESIKEITDRLIYRPYDILNDELVTFATIKVTSDHYVLVASVHHAIQDGAALNALWEQVAPVYTRLLDNPDTTITFDEENFAEFVADDRSHMNTSGVLDFWADKLSSVEPLDFTVPAPIPAPGAYRSQEFYLEPDHWAEVKLFCRKQRITPALYFKVLYGLMIDTYCRPDSDFAIQETMAGRSKGHYTSQGCYIQEIPFVFQKEMFNAVNSISSIFNAARQFQKEIKNYRSISIGEQIALSPRGRIGFMYNYYQFLADSEFLGEVIDAQGTPSDPADNIQFVVTEVRGDLKITLLYHPHVFEDFGFVERVVELSRQIVAGTAEILGKLQYVTQPEELKTLLTDWNATEEEFDLSQCLHQRFEAQVDVTPDAMAIVDDNVQYTYRDLNHRANQLARYLKESGIEIADLVGLCAERSAAFLVGILGIQKAGGAYVPMDPKYPQDRITYMRDNSQVSVVLSQKHLTEKVEGGKDCRVVYLDTDWHEIAAFSNENLNLDVPVDSRAYMIYTSGSTGQPKGAIVRHDGAVNHIEAERKVLDFDGEFSFLQTAPSSSDISVWQFLGPVICGGKSVVLDDVTHAKKLFTLVKEHRIEVVELVPVALQLLMEYVRTLSEDERSLPDLRWMMATGEAVSVDLVNGWLALYPNIPVVNAYGPTEAADDVIQCAISEPLPAGQRSVPIGKPLANLSVLILDDQLRLVPAGVPGEICISGIGVGEGYWNNKAKTDEVFVDNAYSKPNYSNAEYSAVQGDTIYKTGDLGRWLADGSVEYLDRVDNQVKVRGFRIELGEVEAAVSTLPNVREAVVIVRDDMPGGTALAGYVVPTMLTTNEDGTIIPFDVAAARSRLRENLPDYMVPTALVAMESLPLTPAGKVDRKALPKPQAIMLAGGEYVAPRTDMEKALVEIWESLLPVEQVGVTDNFFEIGGHSLIGVRLMARVSQDFSISLQIAELLNAPTIEQLCEKIEQFGGGADWTPLVMLRSVKPVASTSQKTPIFFIHPVGGDVLCYSDLAANIPSDIPVYGLQARGFVSGANVFSSLDEMVDSYVEVIQSQQSEGPYLLAAQSLGGVIAIKVAQKLQAMGEAVQRVVMFDTFTPDAMVNDQLSNVEIIESAIGQPLPKNVRQLAEAGDDEWLERLFNTAKAARMLPDDLTLGQVQSIYNVAVANHNLVSATDLGAIGFPVDHYAAKDRTSGDSSQIDWKRNKYTFNFYDADGDHESMIRGDHAIVLAKKAFAS